MCSKKKKNIKSDILFLGQGFILGSKHSITNKLLSYPVQTIIIIMMMMKIIIIYVAPL